MNNIIIFFFYLNETICWAFYLVIVSHLGVRGCHFIYPLLWNFTTWVIPLVWYKCIGRLFAVPLEIKRGWHDRWNTGRWKNFPGPFEMERDERMPFKRERSMVERVRVWTEEIVKWEAKLKRLWSLKYSGVWAPRRTRGLNNGCFLFLVWGSGLQKGHWLIQNPNLNLFWQVKVVLPERTDFYKDFN